MKAKTPHILFSLVAAVFVTACMGGQSAQQPAKPTPDEASMTIAKSAQSDVFKITVNMLTFRYVGNLRQACLDVTVEALAPYELYILPSWFAGVDKDDFHYLPQMLDTKDPAFPGQHGMKAGDVMRGWLTFYVKDAPTAPILTGLRFEPQVGDAVTVRFKES